MACGCTALLHMLAFRLTFVGRAFLRVSFFRASVKGYREQRESFKVLRSMSRILCVVVEPFEGHSIFLWLRLLWKRCQGTDNDWVDIFFRVIVLLGS
jgi:hypothetical protein